MDERIVWDDSKRDENLAKHGLDFADAVMVLESPFRLDVPARRRGEMRIHSLAYIFDMLAVLSLAHTERHGQVRIISFRKASAEEREAYHEWLENDFEN
jgi:uncharacterized protein